MRSWFLAYLKWTYSPIKAVCKAYVRENPSPKWPYKVQYLHFRYLKLLVIRCFTASFCCKVTRFPPPGEKSAKVHSPGHSIPVTAFFFENSPSNLWEDPNQRYTWYTTHMLHGTGIYWPTFHLNLYVKHSIHGASGLVTIGKASVRCYRFNF